MRRIWLIGLIVLPIVARMSVRPLGRLQARAYQARRLEFAGQMRGALHADGAPAWAGTYSDDGGHHGSEEVLSLSTAGFFYGQGLPDAYYDQFIDLPNIEGDWGEIEPSGSRDFVLRAAWRNDAWGVFGFRRGAPRTLHLIPWDDRMYAVYEDQMADFVDSINQHLDDDKRDYVGSYPYRSRKEARGGLFVQTKPAGLPDLPEAWRSHLLKKPIEAVVTAVGPLRYRDFGYKRQRVVSVSFDAGRRRGLLPGHRLRLRNYNSATEVEITESSEDSASGLARQDDFWAPFETLRLPRVGQRAYSRFIAGDEWEER